MELFNDSSGPTPDQGVLARLKRLDDKLVLTYSTYGIDPATTAPMELHLGADAVDFEDMTKFHKRGNATYLYDPSWYLWTKDPDGRWCLVMTYPADPGFGHREVGKLERDVARTMRPSDIIAAIHQLKGERDAKAKADHKELRADIADANEHRIDDLMDGKAGIRGAKIYSYPGQGNRSTPGTVVMDDKEAGWEKPQQ